MARVYFIIFNLAALFAAVYTSVDIFYRDNIDIMHSAIYGAFLTHTTITNHNHLLYINDDGHSKYRIATQFFNKQKDIQPNMTGFFTKTILSP